jgi:hypothetical protein
MPFRARPAPCGNVSNRHGEPDTPYPTPSRRGGVQENKNNKIKKKKQKKTKKKKKKKKTKKKNQKKQKKKKKKNMILKED